MIPKMLGSYVEILKWSALCLFTAKVLYHFIIALLEARVEHLRLQRLQHRNTHGQNELTVCVAGEFRPHARLRCTSCVTVDAE
jgi:hypothetical protein